MLNISKFFRGGGGTTILRTGGSGDEYLWKQMRCSCGAPMRLTRLAPLHPRGVRGYYACRRGHVRPIDRDGVHAKVVRDDGRRLWFAT